MSERESRTADCGRGVVVACDKSGDVFALAVSKLT